MTLLLYCVDKLYICDNYHRSRSSNKLGKHSDNVVNVLNIYPKYSDTSTPYHTYSKIYYLMCLKIAGLVANSIDPDEMPHSAASHLGLHCLLRPVCPNTHCKYGIHQYFWQNGTQISLFLKHSDQGLYHYENMPIQNILKILPQKNENFQRKNSDIFHFSAQNIDCGYSLEPPHWGSSNEYPQSMFLSRNKKNNVYPYKPHFYYIKVGFKGVKIT